MASLLRSSTRRIPSGYLVVQDTIHNGVVWHWCPRWPRRQTFATEVSPQHSQNDYGPPPSNQPPPPPRKGSSSSSSSSEFSQSSKSSSSASTASTSTSQSDSSNRPLTTSTPLGWEDSVSSKISDFSELPHRDFGFNQHMVINAEFKEALRQILWQFRAPIRYAFAYGSGVFPQGRSSSGDATSTDSPHPHPPEAVTKWQTHGAKNIDFIFGVSFTQHWHSLNLQQHRDHYSFLGSLGSGVVSRVQDKFGAYAYFNPYVVTNGTAIKYGVVNLDTIYRDLSEWDTLYVAGRLQKPVKILRDDPRIRLANQANLISALRVALLMLPAEFTERKLYAKIAGLSYIGDPRMKFRAENPAKVYNIVDAQMANFRQLYLPLIDELPNVRFNDPRTSSSNDWISDPDLNCNLQQNMDPLRRGNMVRRLPRSFRRKLYDRMQRKLGVSGSEYEEIIRESATSISTDDATFAKTAGGSFDQKIAVREDLASTMKDVIRETIMWPTVMQSFKGILTAGPVKSWKYVSEKRSKHKAKVAHSKDEEEAKKPAKEDTGEGKK